MFCRASGPADSRLNVVMVVGSFPSADRPCSGIFNLRAAKLLQTVVNLRVLHLRTWLPGRPFSLCADVEGVPVTTVTSPQVPRGGLCNVLLYRHLTHPAGEALLGRCDIVHSVGLASALIASPWARRAGVRHLFQAIGSDVNAYLPRLKGKRMLADWERHLHAVACNSKALSVRFSDLYPEKQHVRAVWRGVDLQAFQPSGVESGPLASRSPVRYLFLGGFPQNRDLPFGSNTKGGETLLAAWQAAEPALSANSASLLIAGTGALSKRVQAWRSELRHPENVYLHAPLAPGEVAGFVRAADAVLVPSLQEGLPNVAVEAAACGRAVLGSRVGGIPEVVVHDETGILIAANDVEAWREALSETSADSPHLKSMGARARERMEKYFDCRSYPHEMLVLYHCALEEPTTSAGHRSPVETQAL